MELNYNALDDLLEDDFFKGFTTKEILELLEELKIKYKEKE